MQALRSPGPGRWSSSNAPRQRSQSHSRRSAVSTATEQAQPVQRANADLCCSRARAYYEEVWSTGRITALDTYMHEDHEQLDMVWQPQRRGAAGGRRSMKRGILAYRAAYPDLVFKVLTLSVSHVGASPTQQPQGNPSASGVSSVASREGQGSGTAGSATADGQEGRAPHASSPQGPESHGAAQSGPSSSSSAHIGIQEPELFCSVMVHWQASGTNLGPIRGAPPSGKRVDFSGISKLDFDQGGRFFRSWVYRQASPDEAAYFLSQGITPWEQQPRQEEAQSS